MRYVEEIANDTRRFENVFQILRRMILEDYEVRKITDKGRQTYDYEVFRKGKTPIVGMYDTINSIVSFIKDAAEGGSSSELALVLIGEPGGGKTFLINYLCESYKDFLSKPENTKYTFQFKNLGKLGTYGDIHRITSQTYEDPMVLMLNLFDKRDDTIGYLQSKFGFTDKRIEEVWENYRPLGACSEYILNDLKEYCNGDVEQILSEYIDIIPVPLRGSQGVLTGRYSAKDKHQSSSSDLLGMEDISRLLHISDPENPYRINLRKGALARTAGGGIHHPSEICKLKKDLLQVYLDVIQEREIEVQAFKWYLDTFIIGTSNNEEYNKVLSEKEEAPIVDRFRTVFVGHNTDYKLQQYLTRYAIGDGKKKTVIGEELHEDPNLNYAASIAATLTRLPRHKKLTSKEMSKLASGEVAGEKSVSTLVEVIDELGQEPDITKRFGQKGLGQRNLGRAVQSLIESHATNEGKCMFALDVFNAFERIISDYIIESSDREKFREDIKTAREFYREKVNTSLFNAYMGDTTAIEKDVRNYVNMIIGIDAESTGPDNIWVYRDPQTGKRQSLKIDEKFINSVEERLGLKTEEQKESFRTSIRKLYGEKIATDPNYSFMDNVELVKAVTDVRLKSDIAGQGSLAGALANRTNEKCQELYSKLVEFMKDQEGYCDTCAIKTVEYFIEPKDES